MKDSFSSYYSLSNEQFDSLWADGRFIFDSCVLINLYTYSREATGDLLDLLTVIQDRVWLPYQVGLEYHRKRVDVINRHSKSYAELKSKLNTFLTELEHEKQHPFVTEQVLQGFRLASDKLIEELGVGQKDTKSLIQNDYICVKLTEIFDKRVGPKHEEEWLEEVYAEGKTRFSKKIPPGFKDESKGEPRCYGDLLIWKEIITKAAEDSVGILFVTDDVKEDWWRIVGGDTLGAHLDLISEFQSKTGQNIHFYTTDMFLKQARENGHNIAAGTLDEIKAASEDRISRQSATDYYQQHILGLAGEKALRRLSDNQIAIDKIIAGADPLNQLAGNQSAIDKIIAGADPLSQLAGNQGAIDKIIAGADPLSQLAGNQSAIDKIIAGADPLSQFADNQSAIDKFTAGLDPMRQFTDKQSVIDKLIAGSDPQRHLRNNQSAIDMLIAGADSMNQFNSQQSGESKFNSAPDSHPQLDEEDKTTEDPEG